VKPKCPWADKSKTFLKDPVEKLACLATLTRLDAKSPARLFGTTSKDG
jgi:hypothetical protein